MPARSVLVAPSYLPEIAQSVVPWTRRYVAKLSRDGISLEDLWDEAMAALLRACVYYDDTPGRDTKGNGMKAFSTYACQSVIRGCWRYVARAQQRMNRLGTRYEFEELASLASPSAEECASALEAFNASNSRHLTRNSIRGDSQRGAQAWPAQSSTGPETISTDGSRPTASNCGHMQLKGKHKPAGATIARQRHCAVSLVSAQISAASTSSSRARHT